MGGAPRRGAGRLRRAGRRRDRGDRGSPRRAARARRRVAAKRLQRAAAARGRAQRGGGRARRSGARRRADRQRHVRVDGQPARPALPRRVRDRPRRRRVPDRNAAGRVRPDGRAGPGARRRPPAPQRRAQCLPRPAARGAADAAPEPRRPQRARQRAAAAVGAGVGAARGRRARGRRRRARALRRRAPAAGVLDRGLPQRCRRARAQLRRRGRAGAAPARGGAGRAARSRPGPRRRAGRRRRACRAGAALLRRAARRARRCLARGRHRAARRVLRPSGALPAATAPRHPPRARRRRACRRRAIRHRPAGAKRARGAPAAGNARRCRPRARAPARARRHRAAGRRLRRARARGRTRRARALRRDAAPAPRRAGARAVRGRARHRRRRPPLAPARHARATARERPARLPLRRRACARRDRRLAAAPAAVRGGTGGRGAAQRLDRPRRDARARPLRRRACAARAAAGALRAGPRRAARLLSEGGLGVRERRLEAVRRPVEVERLAGDALRRAARRRLAPRAARPARPVRRSAVGRVRALRAHRVRAAAGMPGGVMSPPGRPKGEFLSAQREGTPVSDAQALEVFDCEIGGTRLIEASAGTGKTWALCGLYLRLLLEHGLPVQQILVVTFTNAATAELHERIRSRVVETLAHLRGAAHDGADRFVPTLVETLRGRGLAGDAMALRLDAALQSFDEAAIFTIHGFCQRALADTPFAAQLPLALEALADDAELVAEAANDFWRREVAGNASPPLAAHLAEREDSPAGFATLLARRRAKPLATLRWPRALDAPPPDVDAAALQAAHDAARALWLGGRDAIVHCLQQGRSQLNGNTFNEAAIAKATQGWDTLLDSADPWVEAPDKIDLFGSARQQPKKGCAAPRHAFFDAAQRLLDLRGAAAGALALQRLALLRRLLEEAGGALREAKRRQRVVAFDDMLWNLYERLAGDAGAGLAESLRARFPAALIDEFQDTDPLQFAIFDAVYGGTALPLFLVGDPKQAIYSFRNADLHTYLRARRQAVARYTLADNQRSSEPLIAALNGLFGANADAFMQPGLAFHAVGFGDKRRKPLHDETAAPRAPLQVWLLPGGDPTLAKRDAADAAIASCAAEIARLGAAGLRGEIRLGDAPLRAGDIAVLVRTNAQGSAVRRALAKVGVGSVELSRASVFDSSDAEELARILAAILEPQREPLLRAALATELLGLDAAAIVALGDDEAAWSACIERFVGYRQTWLARGIGTLLRELMHAEGLAARLLARSDGERRLTNWLHLAECLHEASQTHASPDALLRWFDTQRERGGAGGDAAQLRLESDRNLVQIVTVHRAKGLEYAFVFCPLLWDGRTGGPPRSDKRQDGIEYHDDDGQGVIDFRRGLDDAFDEDAIKRRRHLESAAEELRLLYVALTRAVHRCTLVAGGYTTHGGRTQEAGASLLNWLVGGAGTTAQGWLAGTHGIDGIAAAWQGLAQQVGSDAIGVAPLPAPQRDALPHDAVAPERIAALAPPRRIGAPWRIGSYSALALGATHEAAAADRDLRAQLPAGAPAAPDDEAPDSAPAEPLAADDILRFPRGAAAGIALHTLFEQADFADAATWPAAIAAALGVQPAMLGRLLGDVLATPLPVGTPTPLRLAGVPRARRLVELEFHLPVTQLDAAALNGLLGELGLAAPRLDFATLRGYLKGFIDLVVEHEGRYFIVDWKSNHLGDRAADYGTAPLAAAMAAQGYHLQALVYAVALDRLLARRLAGYDAATHFGGVLYLFVRGVRPGWVQLDGSPAGMHFARPTADALARAAALLTGAQAR
ncbi:MAG: exodeoxyribonuclease V subunit beta [Ideonella sp.]|nr:exodeoxyribonuclease V subunit beta [Ideonella sp.]